MRIGFAGRMTDDSDYLRRSRKTIHLKQWEVDGEVVKAQEGDRAAEEEVQGDPSNRADRRRPFVFHFKLADAISELDGHIADIIRRKKDR